MFVINKSVLMFINRDDLFSEKTIFLFSPYEKKTQK